MTTLQIIATGTTLILAGILFIVGFLFLQLRTGLRDILDIIVEKALRDSSISTDDIQRILDNCPDIVSTIKEILKLMRPR